MNKEEFEKEEFEKEEFEKEEFEKEEFEKEKVEKEEEIEKEEDKGEEIEKEEDKGEEIEIETEEEVEKEVFSYDTIVLSGGSSKGILTLGALQYGYDYYFLKNINNYIGTSSGAIICYLLSIGYNPLEILVYICTNQLLEKMQHFNIVAMINGTGASSFTHIQEQLEKMTIEKIGYLPNLGELYSRFGKNLICVTHNITNNSTEYLNHKTHPNLPCITALRMSSNLPLIFERYKYGKNFYIDGGLSDNFAIDIADKIGNKIFGILIMAEDENLNNDPNFNILEYIYKLMFIPIKQSIKYKIANCSEKCKIIKLTYDGVKFFNFNISSKTKLDMFSAGYQQLKNNN